MGTSLPSEAQRARVYAAVERLYCRIARADQVEAVQAAMRQIAGALDGYPVDVQYAAILHVSWRIAETMAAHPGDGA